MGHAKVNHPLNSITNQTPLNKFYQQPNRNWCGFLLHIDTVLHVVAQHLLMQHMLAQYTLSTAALLQVRPCSDIRCIYTP